VDNDPANGNGRKVSTDVLIFKLDLLQEQVADIRRLLETNYVTNDKFRPTQAIALGLASVILTGFAVAVFSLIIKAGSGG
jgi:hypothetical protein